jgi:hypothetical protein
MIDYGITILYVPDEYKHDSSDTLHEVQDMMRDQGMSSVDIAIMHGQFGYQLPYVELISSHDEEEYDKLVDRYISIGHIHQHSVHGKIIAQGSFDRLAHGEEEPKGGVIVTLNMYGDDSWMMLENVHAKVYKTLDYRGRSVDEIKDMLEVDMSRYIAGSMIRIWVDEDSRLRGSVQDIQKLYPGYTIKIESSGDSSSENVMAEAIKFEMLEGFSIDRDNIERYVMDGISDRYDMDVTEMKIITDELRRRM